MPSLWGLCKTWTLDSGLDYGLDYRLDYELDYGLDYGLDFWTGQQTNLAFPGLPAVQYLIASSLVSKVRILQIPMHFFSA